MTNTLLAQKKNRYYLMRHGESLANRRGLIISHPEHALNNYGLTTLGAEQVMTAALNTRLNQDTIIVSSDYLRARETAEIMHSVLSCKSEITFNTNLRERDFGDWELSDHSNYEKVWFHDLNSSAQPSNKVESVTQTLNRGLSVIDSLETEYQDRSILLVSHGDVLQILLAHHHQMNPRFHRSLRSLANADIRSLAKLELFSRTPAA